MKIISRANSEFLAEAHDLGHWGLVAQDNSEIRMTQVRSCDWIVLCEDGLLSPEANHLRRSYYRAGPDGLAKYVKFTAPSEQVPEAVLAGGYYNYYHCLIDYYLNLLSPVVLERPAIPLLVYSSGQSFQEGILDFLGMPNPRIRMPRLRDLRIKKLYIPAKAYRKGHGIGRAQHQALMKVVEGQAIQKLFSAKVFISRQKAGKRRLNPVDQNRLRSVLESEGFECLELETLSYAQQVSAFLYATHVVGVHGAGLANIVYSQSGLRVVELRPTGSPASLPDFYGELAASLGHLLTPIFLHGDHTSDFLSLDPDGIEAVASILSAS